MASQQFNTLQDLFVVSLKKAYSAEKQIQSTIPQVLDSVSTPQLRDVFHQHMRDTQKQISRLEDIFNMLGIKPEMETCHAIQGLIQDAKMALQSSGHSKVKDAALIAAEQAMEHFRIAVYGTLKTWAQEMGKQDVAQKLRETLQEDYSEDKTLTSVAESEVNTAAPMI